MPQASKSLFSRDASLAEASEQLRVLSASPNLHGESFPTFGSKLKEAGKEKLTAGGVEILQVNIGKLCNMTCRHCHVDAGPDRREIMTRETIDHCLNVLRNSEIQTLDLTGGAPEMNPDFRYFVSNARAAGVHVIDRCNLTILLAKGYEDMASFLAENQVEVVASLPCYLPENTDKQRGDGAYAQSIEAIQMLNRLGYGKSGSELRLTLVYNPIGPELPPEQGGLEAAYRDYLRSEYEIEFNRLFTITNMPISRFLEDLIESKQYETYMQTLVDAFNPHAIDGLMCRKMVSVGWEGSLYDCDFNQMLDIATGDGQPRHIRDFDSEKLSNREIVLGQHCFGCTAASGSGCLGAIDI